MKVRELKKLLGKYPDDHEVVVKGEVFTRYDFHKIEGVRISTVAEHDGGFVYPYLGSEQSTEDDVVVIFNQ